MHETGNHRPGDVVNGHVLTQSGWVAVGAPPMVVQVTPAATPTYPGRGMAIAGMVLGIVAWAIAVVSFGLLSGISFVLSVIGLPLAAVAHNQSKRAGGPVGVAVAGIVLNAAGLALAAVVFLLFVIGAASGSV